MYYGKRKLIQNITENKINSYTCHNFIKMLCKSTHLFPTSSPLILFPSTIVNEPTPETKERKKKKDHFHVDSLHCVKCTISPHRGL